MSLDDHFRRKDELTRRHREDQKRSRALFDAVRKGQMDRAYHVAGVPPTSTVSGRSRVGRVSPRLNVPIEDLDGEIVKAIRAVQVDPGMSSEDKAVMTLMYEAAGIDRHIQRLGTELTRINAKVRDLKQKRTLLMQKSQEITRAKHQRISNLMSKRKR